MSDCATSSAPLLHSLDEDSDVEMNDYDTNDNVPVKGASHVDHSNFANELEGLTLYEKKCVLINREIDSHGMGRYQWYIWVRLSKRSLCNAKFISLYAGLDTSSTFFGRKLLVWFLVLSNRSLDLRMLNLETYLWLSPLD